MSVPAPFVHRIRIRYAECDMQGIVFNANWFALFDDTVGALWRERLGGYDQIGDQGIQIVVAETGARFRGAARVEDVIDFNLVVARVGDRSMRVEIAALRENDGTGENELLVEGFLEYVFIELESFTPVAIPDGLRATLEDLTAATA
ncbi:MAG: acyl-CoA thioesterase [Actinobacteria bacterium]|nr:acyl-CoA thioesterase [Actinomycetota bacterium]